MHIYESVNHYFLSIIIKILNEFCYFKSWKREIAVKPKAELQKIKAELQKFKAELQKLKAELQKFQS
jgi:Skp family chaperone for outer membrane proteins